MRVTSHPPAIAEVFSAVAFACSNLFSFPYLLGRHIRWFLFLPLARLSSLNLFFLILRFYYSHGFLECFLFSGIIIIFMIGRLGKIVYFSSKSRKYTDVRVENIFPFICKDNDHNFHIEKREGFVYEKRLQFGI